MSWEKFEKRTVCNRLPVGIVSAGKYRVTIGAASVAAWRLKRFKTVDAYRNTDERQIALQFHTDDAGDYRLICVDNTAVVGIAALLREMGITFGRYVATRDRDGFIVIDFGAVVS